MRQPKHTRLPGETFNPIDYQSASILLQYLNAVELLSQMPIAQTARLIDIGCAGGAITTMIAKSVCPRGLVFGVDVDAEMIAYATSSSLQPNNVAFTTADVLDPDFSTGLISALGVSSRFDIIFSNFVFHWVANDRRASDIWKSLRKVAAPKCGLLLRFSAAGTFAELLAAAADVSQRDRWHPLFPASFRHPRLPLAEEIKASLDNDGHWSASVVQKMAIRRFATVDELTFWFKSSIRPYINVVAASSPDNVDPFAREVCSLYWKHASEFGLSLGEYGVGVRDVVVEVVGSLRTCASNE
jgi:trans-aconitate methyltransferase